jgi:hypothetical protein
MQKIRKHQIQIIIFVLISTLLLAGCGKTSSPVQLAGASSETPLPQSEIVFQVSIPEALSENTGLAVETLDEVTGLAFNPTRYQMQSIDPKSYFVRITVPLGAVIKYRYLKLGEIATSEYTSQNSPVRYRLYYVTGPTIVQDSVAAWIDEPFSGATGTLNGQVLSNTNASVPGMYITIDGMGTFTNGDGSFTLSGIPTGNHNIVAYSLDGAYSVFQQGAVIAENATTPASFQVASAKLVNISFDVTVPEGDYTNVPVRIFGNLYQLGNTFTDLNGGFSTVASRALVLTRSAKGDYQATIQLPAGTYVEYKYSLGDGFWNAEHQDDGRFRLRKIIVPDSDTTYRDTVVTWSTKNFAPITFDVTVPQNTPQEDFVSIQFNPFSWTNVIPMWQLDTNHWYYALYSPLDFVAQVGYRYCRNDQCGIADNSVSAGAQANNTNFTPSSTSQSFHDTVDNWFDIGDYVAPIISESVSARETEFIKGVELAPNYSPAIVATYLTGFANLYAMGANWVFLTPSWTISNTNPPTAIIKPETNPLYQDVQRQISNAKAYNLKVALFPRFEFSNNTNDFWNMGTKDTAWWNEWNSEYRSFILNFAELAKGSSADAIILGGEEISQAIDSPIRDQFKTLISDIRSRFGGTIIWAIQYPSNIRQIPDWLTDIDIVYIQIDGLKVGKSGSSIDEMTASFDKILQEFAQPIKQSSDKPVVIGLVFPSTSISTNGCVQINSTCATINQLDQPSEVLRSLIVDLQSQETAYESVLKAINQSLWVNGFVTTHYYLPAKLQDASNSIHGKPAEDVVRYWFYNWY